MPPANTNNATGGLASVLSKSRGGTFKLPISSFVHTTSGRLLREAGVKDLYDDIKKKGWLSTNLPTVCLLGDPPEGGLNAENVDSYRYRMINGNHRLKALRRLLQEQDPFAPSAIEVDVHTGLSLDMERHIAFNLNSSTEMLVKTTLFDRIVWHKGWYDQMQSSRKSKAPLTAHTIATRLHSQSKKDRVACQSLPPIKECMRLVEAFKPRGLAALEDVTRLEGRPEKHPDRERLLYKRVIKKAVLRPEFAELTDVEQEAYIYRLASGAMPSNISDEDYLKLDEMAKQVGRMMSAAEAVFPRSEWNDAFKELFDKSRNYEASSRFVVHHNARDKAASDYRSSLPAGMAPNERYEAFIRNTPWSQLLMAAEGSAASPNSMQHLHDEFKKVKENFEQEAIADEGRFKANLAAHEKKTAEAAEAAAKAREAAEAAAAAPSKASEAAAASAAASQAAREANVAKDNSSAVPRSTSTITRVPATPASSAASSTQPSTSVRTPPSSDRSADSTKEVNTVAGHKRKADALSTAAELSKRARPIMSKLGNIDIFDNIDVTKNVRSPSDCKYMIAFLNIAEHHGVLSAAEEEKLARTLDFLAANMHDRGTLAIALPDMGLGLNFERLKGVFKTAGLILEDHPIISAYLHAKSGRISKKNRFLYPQQASVTLLAHKELVFICNGGGARSKEGTDERSTRIARVAHPRTAELDRIGVVVSLRHPASGTHLADSVAELIIRRFSDVGDAILLTAVNRDRALCRMALQEGRSVVALEPDESRMKDASDNLDAWAAEAAKSGMWARMLAGPVVTVGQKRLPALVPPSNVPASTAGELEEARNSGRDYPPDIEFPHELQVAATAAEMHGLEIRDSPVHGQGLFAKKDFNSVEDFIPVPLEGSFEVHDSPEECLHLAKKTGIPRFKVASNMSRLLSDSEVARPTSALYLVPARTCPLFYMNSSEGDPEEENVVTKTMLNLSRDLKKGVDIKQFLGNAKNAVCFTISGQVKKGDELLVFYEIGESGEESSE